LWFVFLFLQIKNKVLKIGDFGFASFRATDASESPVGTPYFMDPDLIRVSKGLKDNFDPFKADIYSFAIVMFCIMADKDEPFVGYNSRTALFRDVLNGKRPAIQNHTFITLCPVLSSLMQRCWAGNPEDRPDWSEVRHTLEYILTYPFLHCVDLVFVGRLYFGRIHF
jgi:serine/threonine protein kinase